MKVIFQFRFPGPRPTLDMVCERFGLHPEEVDQAYGVALVDPRDSTYIIRVDDTVQARLNSRGEHPPGTGFFADPQIG